MLPLQRATCDSVQRTYRMAVGPPANELLKTMTPSPLALSSGWHSCVHGIGTRTMQIQLCAMRFEEAKPPVGSLAGQEAISAKQAGWWRAWDFSCATYGTHVIRRAQVPAVARMREPCPRTRAHLAHVVCRLQVGAHDSVVHRLRVLHRGLATVGDHVINCGKSREGEDSMCTIVVDRRRPGWAGRLEAGKAVTLTNEHISCRTPNVAVTCSGADARGLIRLILRRHGFCVTGSQSCPACQPATRQLWLCRSCVSATIQQQR